MIIKDLEYFKQFFENIEPKLKDHKTIKLTLIYNNEFNYFQYGLKGLFNDYDYDNIFNTTSEMVLNEILKYLMNKNYYIIFDFINY